MSDPWPPPPSGMGAGWVQYPPGTPTTNGVAIAAMVIGIASLLIAFTVIFAFVSFVPGIVAIVLGVMGLSRARQHPTGLGRAAAVTGIVCGVLATLATVLAFAVVALFVASSDFELEDRRVAAPDEYELEDQRCVVEDRDQAVASGVLVNQAGTARGFALAVQFSAGRRDLGVRADQLEHDLEDGESWAWSVALPLDPTDEIDDGDLRCHVVRVELFDVDLS